MTTVTSSGISIKKLITRLADLQEQRGHVHRPFFADMHGNRIKAKTIELELMEKLQVLKHSQPSQIPDDVDIYEDLGISRSFRWGATSTTRVQGVDDKHVILINRWRTFKNAKGRRPIMSMQDHYSAVQILLPKLVKFSLGL
jgi:hypothetical protein